MAANIQPTPTLHTSFHHPSLILASSTGTLLNTPPPPRPHRTARRQANRPEFTSIRLGSHNSRSFIEIRSLPLTMRVFAILTTLLPLLAHAAHNQPPYLRHRRIAAEAVQHVRAEPKALVAPRANIAHSEAHNVIKRAVKKRSGQCRARSTSSSSTAPAATSAWPSSSDTAAQSSDASQPWSSDASQPSPAVQAWAQPSKVRHQAGQA